MAETPTYTYPFDPTGSKSTNLIQGERQVISPPNWIDFYFIIPGAAPYFRETLQVVHHPSGRILVEGVDYSCSHRFHDASLAIAKPVYGSITFYDKTLAGTVELSYQTLGGAWTLDETTILEILSEKTMDPRITTWEEVVDMPFQFPVIDHQWDLVDLVGATELEEALQGIRDAISATGEGGLQEHLADFDNPHRVTAEQVGLGDVENYKIATVVQATAGTDNTSYMTPLRTAQSVNQFAVIPLNTHKSNYENPHGVTKAQVGLDKVQNFRLANTQEAKDGTSDTVYMTPLTTAAAIQAQTYDKIGDHLADHNNPHQVTATQVGLGKVENYGIATIAEAKNGTADNVYMTPATTMAAINNVSSPALLNHINDHSNPHQVTSAQVGLGNVKNYKIATVDAAMHGTDTTSYMTPALTRVAIENLSTADFNSHINNTNNPHQVTAAQVGLGNVKNYTIAGKSAAEAGTSNSYYMTPLTTANAINALAIPVIHDHINDNANPHNVTKDQVGLGNVENYAVADKATAEAGSSITNYMTPLSTYQAIDAQAKAPLRAHVQDYNNPHAVSAAQLGVYTIEQADEAIQEAIANIEEGDGMASDSEKLQGHPWSDVLDLVALLAANLPNAVRFDHQVVQAITDPDTQVTTMDGVTWTKVVSIPIQADPETQLLMRDTDIIVSGGDAKGTLFDSVYRVKFSMRDYNLFSVETLYGDASASEYGFVEDTTNNLIDIWVKSPPLRNALTVIGLDGEAQFLNLNDDVVEEEPAGIQYATTYDVRQHTPAPSTGDVVTGSSFSSVNGLVNAPMIQWANILPNGADPTTAQAMALDLEETIHDLDRRSIYGSEKRRAGALADSIKSWHYDSVSGEIKNTATSFGKKALNLLLLPQYLPAFNSDFTFEVEITCDATTADDFAAGICFAHADAGQVTDAFYAIRTPGGLIAPSDANAYPGKNFYKLLTVGRNLFEGNAQDLGSTSAGLNWGDGVADSNRASTPYAPASWSTLGVMRLKATKTGTTLVIETTNFGSTTYVEDAKVTIDLTQYGDTLISGGQAIRVGLCLFNQPQVNFKLLSYPGQFQPYVELGATTSDAPQPHYYNGSAWATGVDAETIIFPGRLYYSTVNGKLYYAMRDGYLKALNIEAYTDADHTVLTT